MVNKPGYSFGPEHPIHYRRMCPDNYSKWYVFDARTNDILYIDIEREDQAMKLAMQENEKLGFGCKPDINGIDSTP